MLYLSRGEQATLVVLAALLLGGAGVVTYRRGMEAGGAREGAPLFVEASPVRGGSPSPTRPPSAVATQYAPAGPATVPARPTRPRAATAGPISLNRATLEQLDSLPGVGPVYAQRILDYRAQLRRDTGHGFTSVDELLNVPGIGPKRLAALRDRVNP